MCYILADVPSMIDWANTVLAVLGVVAAVIALIQSSRSNAAAKDANQISRAANELAKKAVEMQEDESRVRLVVRPRIVVFIDDEEEEGQRPRTLVEVINLSAFPVTITKISWKTNDANKWFYWKNPTISDPFVQLPARLPSKEELIAFGTPATFPSLEELQAVTAAVAFTSCGEQVEGMTSEWRDEVTRMVKEATGSGHGGHGCGEPPVRI